MRLAELGRRQVGQLLGRGELRIQTGPFVTQVKSPIPAIADGIDSMYANHPVAPVDSYPDFRINVSPAAGLRRWIKPQAIFGFDGRPVFEPMPLEHAYPLLEWSMNWCVASQAHQFLMIHAAVIERHGCAVILPAPPGSGKSTLCAGLIHAGWRLLSDEMALVDRDGSGRLWPLCRPVSLKNASIDIIRAWAPDARLSRLSFNTTKGAVCHLQAPAEHVARMHEPAVARWVIFPRWAPGVPPTLTTRPRAGSVVDLAHNSFNYGGLGQPGFDLMVDLVRSCDCYDFEYSHLSEAVAVFDRLAQEVRP